MKSLLSRIASTAFLLMLFGSPACRKKSLVPETDQPSTTIVSGAPLLHSFDIKITDTTAGDATVEWTPAVDNQHDSIVYTVLLDDTEIASRLQARKYVFARLTLAKKYRVQIKAIDRKNNTLSVSTGFIKNDGYLKFAKMVMDDVSATDLVVLPDKGYLFSTIKHNTVNNDVLLVRTDSLGNIIWKNSFVYEWREVRLRVTTDGFFVMGYYYLLKIGFDGTLIWSSILRQPQAVIKSMLETKSREILLVSNEPSGTDGGTTQATLTKLNAKGEIIFKKKIGTTRWNNVCDIAPTGTEGEFYAFGTRSNLTSGKEEFYAVQMDQSANVLWEKTYSGMGYDFAVQVRLINNQLLLGGYSMVSQAGEYEMVLLRTDTRGNLLKRITLKEAYYNSMRSVEPAADSGYIVNASIGKGSGFVTGVFRYDKLDNRIWYKTYAPDGYYSVAYAVKQTADGGYIIPVSLFTLYGSGNNSIWLYKTNPSGAYE